LARKILLADDSVTAQNMGRKILSDAGYEVITVNNGSAALKKIAELKPDLVVLDVYMPGYSGLEVCQRLKDVPETARMPVLLTVGKLEPFKPEECKRVKADGFIVKPFEASELLSVLSKLQDKIVPRPEPAKPGRFAKAVASADAASEGRKSDSTREDSGWKDRIGFPSKKAKTPEAEGEPSIYNAVNRDLRTIAATEKKPDAPQPAHSPSAMPDNLPQDITPEEVAALAAAVAQIRGGIQPSSESAQVQADPATPPVEVAAQPEPQPEPQIETANAPAEAAAATPASSEESHAEPVTFAGHEPIEQNATASLAAAEQSRAAAESENLGREAEVMAAVASLGPETVSPSVAPETNSAGSRWTAVPVAMQAEENGISLEREMENAQAATAAAETASETVASVAVAEIAPAQTALAEAPATESVEAAVAVAIDSGVQDQSSQHSNSEDSSSQYEAPLSGESVSAEPVEQKHEPLPAPVAEDREAIAASAEPEPATSEFTKRGEVDVPAAEAVAVASAVPDENLEAALEPAFSLPEVAAFGAYAERASVSTPEEKAIAREKDSDMAASTAAAWAQWRQVRDLGNGKSETPVDVEAAKAGFAEVALAEVVSTQPETAAMSVAAGAEKSPEHISAEVVAAADSGAIASIVDSMLAELRPKIMAELSRKMAAEKK
jgi:CheY-like chemotaxis protein